MEDAILEYLAMSPQGIEEHIQTYELLKMLTFYEFLKSKNPADTLGRISFSWILIS